MGVIQLTEINPNIYMSSSQTIRELHRTKYTRDQYGNTLTMKGVYLVCVASNTLCSEFKDIASGYVIRDLPNQEFALVANKATDEVCKHLRRRRKVIVFCNMGRNRSCLVVMLYILRISNMTYSQAFSTLVRNNSRRLERSYILSNPEYSKYLQRKFEAARK